MLKDAGQKIDWLSGQDLEWLQTPDGQHWLNYLRMLEEKLPDLFEEGKYHPDDVDQLAPFLTKEYRKGRFTRYEPGDPQVIPDSYSVPYTEIPKWAEYLRSRRGIGTRLLSPDYAWQHLTQDRRSWDSEYDDRKWQGLYKPSQLKALDEAMDKRQRELEHPVPERRDLKQIEPTFYWWDLMDGLNRRKPDLETLKLVADTAKRHKQVQALGEQFATFPDLAEGIRPHLAEYVHPQTGQLQNEPAYTVDPIPGFEWGEAKPVTHETVPEEVPPSQDSALFESQPQGQARFTQEQLDRLREIYRDEFPENEYYDINRPAVHADWEEYLRNRPAIQEQVGRPHYPEGPWHYAKEQSPWWKDEYYSEGYSDPMHYIEQSTQGVPQEYRDAHDAATQAGYDPPELIHGDNDWHAMVHSFVHAPKFDKDLAHRLERTALERGDWDSLMHEGILPWLRSNGAAQDDGTWNEHKANDEAIDHWSDRANVHTHPVTGEIESPQIDPTGEIQTAWGRWWKDHSHLYRSPMGGQTIAPGTSIAKIAALSAPLYYRWAFNPDDGTVTLDHNESTHPAFVQTPSAMRDSEHSTHGYAYRISGGWRLTDYEHNPVSDPFIVAQVVRTIRGEDGRKQADGIWQFREPDYDRLHYGQPVEDK